MMTQNEFEAFVSRRLAHHQSFVQSDETGPLSTFIIHEELGWTLGQQKRLFADENSRIEFKSQLPSNDESLSKILKTIAAFANRNGGYIFFGVEDVDSRICGITIEEWSRFDWDRFAALLTKIFQPSVDWNSRQVEYNGHQLGVIYVHALEVRPTISTQKWHQIGKTTIYLRYARSSEPIHHGDLMRMLGERDEIVRKRAQIRELDYPKDTEI